MTKEEVSVLMDYVMRVKSSAYDEDVPAIVFASKKGVVSVSGELQIILVRLYKNGVLAKTVVDDIGFTFAFQTQDVLPEFICAAIARFIEG